MKITFSKNQLLFVLFILFASSSLQAQSIDTSFYNSMKWRSIGPYRGGRTVGAAGVPQQPNIFYIGVNNGGVWKTTDYGRTWLPIFDDESTGSIGTIAVAPSNPNIIYVGSGEGLHRPDLSTGNGMYKSIDAGKTWMHLGLRDGQQIPKIAIDPKNPDRLFVAVLGHPYGPNEERGIFRSVDGGKTFEKVFYIDENTGGDDVDIDPNNPDIIYATLWESREGPWENGEWSGTKGGVFKSTDGGNTWKKLSANLPHDMVQAHIAIAPSSSNILYLTVGTTETNEYGTGTGMGLFRSDDGGENWKEVTDDGRPQARIGGGDVPEIMVDAKDPETLYSTSIVVWKSIDGGKKWKGIRGAPGGDDYQNLWINPIDTKIILVTGDQGALVTVNGGDTWSSWYNQPTAQLYHVSADNAFPYNLYSGQQESGSVGIASRGNDGEITFRDWHPVGAQEYGYVAADPLNSNIVYGGKISKYNKLTGQVQSITPSPTRNEKFRYVRTEPVIFSPVDSKTLFFAGNFLFKTQNGGDSWNVISPDLSREIVDIPASVGIYKAEAKKTLTRRGVIYTVAPSPLDVNLIWAGTDDGLIHVTTDGGKKWNNVTPSELTSWSKVSLIDASHFNKNTAYAAINRLRCDDLHPYIYKTNDGGKNWIKITSGLPDDPINAVREDPKTKGLLFAASETQVYVSFDDGTHWQTLRLNMPATSIRDVIIKDNDLAIATHGRGFWILDDIAPLRQISEDVIKHNYLFKPSTGLRVRWNLNTDTPLPPDEPAGQNPPDGAIIDYYLKENSNKKVTLNIFDAKGNLVRHYSSNDTLYKIPEVDIPLYWIRPQEILSANAGPHRFVWDLHYSPLNIPPSYPISAIYKNTAPEPTSPLIMPGTYKIVLKVNGQTFSQPLTIKMDPRVKTSLADLQRQHDFSLMCYEGRKNITSISNETISLHNQIKDLRSKSNGDLHALLDSLDEKITNLENAKPHSKTKSFNQVYNSYASLFNQLQESDMAPNSRIIEAVKLSQNNFIELNEIWKKIKTTDIPGVNKELKEAGLPGELLIQQ
ncbi:MAG: glycoside hydrolase [Bacteroidota bacterium]|nr:glycoside hydrolase [Bacteroidota bacterium]